MKKILSITMLLAIGMFFTACQSEEEDFFDSSAAERLAASKATYTQRLPQATAGWAMEFYPTNGNSAPKGAGYLLLAKFNTDRSVSIAFKNTMTNWVYQEDTSLWEVIADQGPVLSFNTYNKCLHIFADPAFYDTGLGYEGDYEFEIISLEDNARFAMLKGKKRGTYVRMTRLEEGTDFEQYLTEVDSIQSTLFDPTAPNDLLICFGDKRYVINDVADGFLSFYPEGGDAISQTESHPFLITKRDGKYYLRFRDEVRPDSVDESNSIQEIVFEATADRFVDPDNSDKFIASSFSAKDFFASEFGKGHVFTVNRNAPEGELSEKMRKVLDEAHNGIKAINKNFFINELSLKVDTINGARWSYKYQSGKAAPDIEYIYNCQTEGNNITFSYISASKQNGENIKNRVTAISNMLEQTLSQQFVITAFVTEFNLSKLKFTAVNDADLWFVINY